MVLEQRAHDQRGRYAAERSGEWTHMSSSGRHAVAQRCDDRNVAKLWGESAPVQCSFSPPPGPAYDASAWPDTDC